MNKDVYVEADFTLPGHLPKPAAKDIAESFGLQSGIIDPDSKIRPVDGQPGTWRAGIRSDRSAQVTRAHPDKIRINGSDFYIK